MMASLWRTESRRELDPHLVLSRLSGVRKTGPDRWVARCPAHDDRTPSLSVRWTGDKVLLYCFAGCSYRDIVEALDIRWGDLSSPPPPPVHPEPPKRQLSFDAMRLWESASPVLGKDHPVLRYLQARGLEVGDDIPDLRFVPSLGYYEDGELKGRYPAMLAAVRDAFGQVISVHRTYLAHDYSGKALVKTPKKLTKGCSSGGGIWLYSLGPVVAVAEGIETALAVRLMTRLPVVATISATHMARWEPPPVVKEVLIAADADKAGAKGARDLLERLHAIGVRGAIYAPPRGMDWLDAYLEGERIY